jgi:hypothetical protein
MKNLLYTILFAFSFSAQAQIVYETDLPLIVPQGGDTTIFLTSDFHIGGENFVPQDTVTLKWIDHLLSFYLYGLANTTIDGQTFRIHFGTVSDARVNIASNGIFILFDPFVVDTFTIEGQKFIGGYDSTHYTINYFTSNIEIYGDVQIIVDNTAYPAVMGDMGHPGFVSHNDDAEVWVHMKDNIAIKGLKPTGTPNIILKHSPNDPNNTYYGRGDMVVIIDGDVLAASIGSNKKPGLILTNSTVDSASMTLAGGGLLLGLLPILNNFKIEYNHYHKKWAINGNVILGVPMGGVAKLFGAKIVPSVVIDAGTDSTAGFFYNTSTHKFTVNDAIFELNNINNKTPVELGGFALNKLALRVQDNVPDSINCIVTIPPGFGVDASLAWELTPQDPHYPFVVTSIQARYDVKDINYAPPLGTSGFFLASMGGGITNLNKPKDMTFTGGVGLMYGKPLELDLTKIGLNGKKEYSIAYMWDEVSLSAHGLTLEADGYLGAIFTAGKWTPALGTLMLSAEIKWGGKYKLGTKMSMFGPPNFHFLDAGFDLTLNNKGDIDGLGSVDLFIPKKFPIVGGKKLAKVEGAFRHHHDAVSHSYGAGWFKVNLGFDKMHLGMKTTFDGDTKKIGAKEQKAIVKQITSAEEMMDVPDQVWCTVNQHFTVDAIKPAAYFQNQLVVKDGSTFLGGSKVKLRFQTLSPGGVQDIRVDIPETQFNTFYNEGASYKGYHAYSLVSNILITDTFNYINYNRNAQSYTSIDWVHQPDLLLAPGEYLLKVTGTCLADNLPSADVIEFRASPVYPRPTIDISLQPNTNHEVKLNYTSYLTDSTTISVYWNTTDSTNGRKLLYFDYYDGIAIGDSVRQIMHHYDPGILTQDTIYLYAVIDDHVNPPVFSEIKFDIYPVNLRILTQSEGMQIILEPTDTTMDYISQFTGEFNPKLGLSPDVYFYNVPPGQYTVEAFLHDSTHHFDNMKFISYYPVVAAYTTTYKSPEWLHTKMNVLDFAGDYIDITYNVLPGKALLYGNFIDPEGNMIVDEDIDILIMDDSSNVVASKTNVTNGHYVFTDIDLSTSKYIPDFYNVAVHVPQYSSYYWHDVRTERLISTPQVYGIVHYETDVYIPDYAYQSDFVIEKGAPGDPQGIFFHAKDFNVVADIEGVFISLSHTDSSVPIAHAVTNKYGIAVFQPEDLVNQTTYNISVMWPKGYQQVAAPPTFKYTGSYLLQNVVGEKP